MAPRCTPSPGCGPRWPWPPTARPAPPPRPGSVGCTPRWPPAGLDTYRAAVIAAELAEAPPQVAATVVAALEGHFGSEDAAHLRRRCRRVLTRISPDLLVQRARRAREECGLRRWADEPGVDKWVGTFPSEEAATGLGGDRRPGPPVPQPGCLPDHRTRPRQSPDRPGRRQRHHRHDPDRHRPRHRPARSPTDSCPRRGGRGQRRPRGAGRAARRRFRTGQPRRRGRPGRGHRPQRRPTRLRRPQLAHHHRRTGWNSGQDHRPGGGLPPGHRRAARHRPARRHHPEHHLRRRPHDAEAAEATPPSDVDDNPPVDHRDRDRGGDVSDDEPSRRNHDNRDRNCVASGARPAMNRSGATTAIR